MMTTELKPNSEPYNQHGLKLVKNATVFSENGVIFCRHYDTIIFAFNPQTREAQARFNCSATSNRQIKFCLDFFDLDKSTVTDMQKIEGYSNWAYSRPL